VALVPEGIRLADMTAPHILGEFRLPRGRRLRSISLGQARKGSAGLYLLPEGVAMNPQDSDSTIDDHREDEGADEAVAKIDELTRLREESRERERELARH
jgi:hypothetical protein